MTIGSRAMYPDRLLQMIADGVCTFFSSVALRIKWLVNTLSALTFYKVTTNSSGKCEKSSPYPMIWMHNRWKKSEGSIPGRSAQILDDIFLWFPPTSTFQSCLGPSEKLHGIPINVWAIFNSGTIIFRDEYLQMLG
jgi:hypothetical protein